MNRRWRTILITASALLGAAQHAHAQAPINSNVALQPSKGGLIIRQQFRYTEGEQSTLMGELDVELASSITTFVYGLSDELTLILDSPFILSRRVENDTTGVNTTDSGFADLKLLSKLRLYRDDFGPNDTSRFDLIAGIELPTGRNMFSSDSYDPIVGGVYTYVHGRHSFSSDLLWQFNTGGGLSGDRLQYDSAYLYRLFPEQYASDSPTALFGAVELNGIYETNGDHELFLSPGIQYVTTRWVLEATVQLPIAQNLDHRAERKFILGLGIRVQF